MRNHTDTPRTIAVVQLEDGTRLTAETPSLGTLTLTFDPPAPDAEEPFTSTLPSDDGHDWPATENHTLESISGHREGLDVQAVIEPSGAPIFHVGNAVLDHATARALVDYLSELLTVTEDMPAPAITEPEEQPEAPRPLRPGTCSPPPS